MQQQRLHVDFVLQKEHLKPHDLVHETMYMPSHSEFVIEVMSRLGFKPNLSLGIDDFAQASFLYNQSAAEVLVVCGVDQHLKEAFSAGWQQVHKRYAKKVLLVSEPIFSPLAYYVDEGHNAAHFHEQFIHHFAPDIVMYLSAYDVLEARKRYPQQVSLLYSLADPDLCLAPVLPWAEKANALLWLGKTQAWEFSRRVQQLPTAQSRAQQQAFFESQTHLPFRAFKQQFTFRECYQVANQYRFQLQPLSGFAFHSARAVQAAIVQSIPILLLHREDLPLLAIEAPFAKPGQNCLVGLEGEYDRLFAQMQDQSLLHRIVQRLPELLQAGTIQSCLRDLGLALLS